MLLDNHNRLVDRLDEVVPKKVCCKLFSSKFDLKTLTALLPLALIEIILSCDYIDYNAYTTCSDLLSTEELDQLICNRLLTIPELQVWD